MKMGESTLRAGQLNREGRVGGSGGGIWAQKAGGGWAWEFRGLGPKAPGKEAGQDIRVKTWDLALGMTLETKGGLCGASEPSPTPSPLTCAASCAASVRGVVNKLEKLTCRA